MFFSMLQSRTRFIIVAHRDMLAEMCFLSFPRAQEGVCFAVGGKLMPQGDNQAEWELCAELCCFVQGITAPQSSPTRAGKSHSPLCLFVGGMLCISLQ